MERDVTSDPPGSPPSRTTCDRTEGYNGHRSRESFSIWERGRTFRVPRTGDDWTTSRPEERNGSRRKDEKCPGVTKDDVLERDHYGDGPYVDGSKRTTTEEQPRL